MFCCVKLLIIEARIGDAEVLDLETVAVAPGVEEEAAR